MCYPYATGETLLLQIQTCGKYHYAYSANNYLQSSNSEAFTSYTPMTTGDSEAELLENIEETIVAREP